MALQTSFAYPDTPVPYKSSQLPESEGKAQKNEHSAELALEAALGWGKPELPPTTPDIPTGYVDDCGPAEEPPMTLHAPEEAEKTAHEAAHEEPGRQLLGLAASADRAETLHSLPVAVASETHTDVQAIVDTENKPISDSSIEEDAGVATLLMMRRNKGNDKAPLPAPLSKAAIKTPATGQQSAMGSAFSPGRGLASSHPYYRSARVLASPLVYGSRVDRRVSSRSGVFQQTTPGREQQSGANRPRLERGFRASPDVRYEQQRTRGAVVYRYPPRAAMQEKEDRWRKEDRWTETDKRPASPRVYIPPPIFSPRRAPSDSALPTQSSLASTRNLAELPRPHSVASERDAASLLDGSAAQRLQFLHQPYKSASSTTAQHRREAPKYPDYFGGGNGPMPSPIRESFVRSNTGSRGREPLSEPEKKVVYRGGDTVTRPLGQGPPSQSSQHFFPDKTDSRLYNSNLKRPAPDEYMSQFGQRQHLKQVVPHLRVPQTSAEDYPTVKRARTDSAESSTSGSGASPPNRMRYIAPPAGNAGTHLIPHTNAKPSEAAQQRRQGAYRSPSPAGGQADNCHARGPAASGREDLGTFLSQVISGRSDRSATETARALADVAVTLAQVAKSLEETMS